MEIIFDPAKDAANIAKHGISLSEAGKIEWDGALVKFDKRYDYGEPRETAMAFIGMRIYVVVFVERQDCRRIISLRKANKREVHQYAKA